MIWNATWPLLSNRNKPCNWRPCLSLCFYSLTLLFLSPLCTAIKRAAERDYRRIPDAGLKTSFGGYFISYPILQLSKELSPLPPAVAFTKLGNTVPSPECQECLTISLMHKKDFGVPGSKCIIGGIGSHICKLC